MIERETASDSVLRMKIGMVFLLALLALSPAATLPAQAEPRHGIAMHGAPELVPGFPHFPYADPSARRGGVLRLAAQGSFDGLNPFIVKGSTAAQGVSPYIVQPLMARSHDEPFSLYGLIAKSIETPDDRSWVEFVLDPRARFSDGTPLRAADVAFSWKLLKEHGRPNLRAHYAKVLRIESEDPLRIRFVFKEAEDRELPLILALMPIFAAHATDPERFEETSFTAPLGSGPYVVAAVEPGKSLTYKRNPNFWADEVPSQKGFYNFDEIKIDYYRDSNSLFESFKAGLYDIRVENDPQRWVNGYGFPAALQGRVVKEAFALEAPTGMFGYALNTRRARFADMRVREALAELFDFEWVAQNLYSGAVKRSASYFNGSALSALGRAADARERNLLAPYPDAVRADILEGRWSPPKSDGSGRDRASVQRALRLFAAAGYRIENGALKDAQGETLGFEILVNSREYERLSLTYAEQLRRAGIVARVRQVDAVQYQKRLTQFDFDLIVQNWPVSASPGNEQRFRWGSAAADTVGSFNFPGVKSPAADALLDKMLNARERDDFVAATRAFDRILLSGFYVVPLFHIPDRWIARSADIRHPDRLARYETIVDVWWKEAEKR